MASFDVAVLGGTGRQGRGLAQRLTLAGYPVVVGSRDPARAEAAAAVWRADARPRMCTDFPTAIASADVVLLVVPFDGLGALLESCGGRFRSGSLAVDVTVPVIATPAGISLADIPEGSATAFVRARLPETVRVAGTFKTLPAGVLGDLDCPLDCDEFVCGDSEAARADASKLVEAIKGVRAIDVGPISRARSIEHMTLLAIAINRRRKAHDVRFTAVGA